MVIPRLNRVNVQKFQQLNTNARKSIAPEVPLLKIENILCTKGVNVKPKHSNISLRGTKCKPDVME